MHKFAIHNSIRTTDYGVYISRFGLGPNHLTRWCELPVLWVPSRTSLPFKDDVPDYAQGLERNRLDCTRPSDGELARHTLASRSSFPPGSSEHHHSFEKCCMNEAIPAIPCWQLFFLQASLFHTGYFGTRPNCVAFLFYVFVSLRVYPPSHSFFFFFFVDEAISPIPSLCR